MGVDCNIKLDFKIKFNKTIIETIIDKTQKAGCEIYSRSRENGTYPILSHDEAVTYFYEGYKIPKEGGALYASKDSAHFIIYFYQNIAGLGAFGLMLASNHWEKTFSDGKKYIDFARYIRFLMHITQNFPLDAINIEYE